MLGNGKERLGNRRVKNITKISVITLSFYYFPIGFNNELHLQLKVF